MFGLIKRYVRWLHTQWPAGVVEKLPKVNDDFSTNIPGLYITGDLSGNPLLKFSSDSGAKAVKKIIADRDFQKQRTAENNPDLLDLVIVGAGVSGMAAALEARKAGLRYEILEATEPFSTVVNFPRGKPIYTYPTEMIPIGDLQFTATVKEPLVDELKAQTIGRGIEPRLARVEKVEREGGYFDIVILDKKNLRARRVVVGIGRSGNFRKLGVPGEDLDKVFNRLHDPKDFSGRNVLVVGGGDTAIETAIAIAQCGGYVTISYRRAEFSRPKPDNLEKLAKLLENPMADVAVETPTSERVTTSTGGFIRKGQTPGEINLMMSSQVKDISEAEVFLIDSDGKEITIPNDAVFTMIGREAPLDFFRRSGVKIKGELGAKGWISLALFLVFATFVYHWKSGGILTRIFEENGWFPYNIPNLIQGLGNSIASKASDPSTLIGTLTVTLEEPGFYYSILYSFLVVLFGVIRIKRRKTPYIRVQTISLMFFQLIPLFLLPYILLPYLGHNGMFDSGILKSIADSLFPEASYGHGREYWRAFGLILAWPLFIWNVFSYEPLWGWLIISLIQTFIIIPAIIYFWGKGAYCGWVCSCGALAETLGDNQRHKMPHGSKWNRVNLVGQFILALAFLLLVLRVISWITPNSSLGQSIMSIFDGLLYNWSLFGIPINYKWFIDLFLAGIIGYGMYFWFSGR
ncbi:MAG: NAD(P)-binding domain-containing protein, partial [Thermodesulfobacteriota bacterium]